MKPLEMVRPPLTLVAWSRVARPLHDAREVRRSVVDRTASRTDRATQPLDDVLFGCSATLMALAPLATVVAAIFG